ncbi:hypothetical protein [Staphylococcus chromogenes]|uniref:hypothetical protein n=1 Tax=Staphylococcus chromogenes TaxID=46126 RepID=UPI00105721B4|nr:hypothetical protein [Staphylococcus chromogenes]
MWIDITHQLSKDWAPWPGDPAFELHFFETKANNGTTNIAKLAGSTHIATMWMRHDMSMIKGLQLINCQ